MQSRQVWTEGVLRRIEDVEAQFGRLKEKERHARFGGGPAPEEYAEFNTACLAIIDYACGPQDTHYKLALQAVDRHDEFVSAPLAGELAGMVLALKKMMKTSGLLPIREAERTGILVEFLSFGDALLAHGRTTAAGVVLSGVVEVHLRHLSRKYSTAVGERNIKAVHAALAATVYPGVDATEVERWLAVGEKATSGAADSAVQNEAVAAALNGVHRFLARYPA